MTAARAAKSRAGQGSTRAVRELGWLSSTSLAERVILVSMKPRTAGVQALIWYQYGRDTLAIGESFAARLRVLLSEAEEV